MIGRLFNRDATVYRAIGSSFPVKCALQQVRRDDASGHGPGFSVTEWRLFLPVGTALTAADEVEVDGQRFQVAGQPWVVHNEATGLPHHVEATLKVTGSATDDGPPGEDDFGD